MRYVWSDVDSEFLELAIQFGHISLFSVAFPLAPLFAFVNNVYEGSVDLVKFSNSKRYSLQFRRSRIGIWIYVFELLGFISVLTNTWLLCYASSNLDIIIPDGQYEAWLLTPIGRVVVFFLLEHIMVGLKHLLAYILDSSTDHEHDGTAVGREKHGVQTRLNLPKSVSKSRSDIGTEDAEIDETTATFDSELIFKIPRRNLNATPFFSDPLLFLFAFMIAPLMHVVGISSRLYMPIAVLITFSMQINKRRDVSAKATALRCDEDVVKELLGGNMPPWVNVSCFERVGWLNATIQRLWPFAGKWFAEDLLKKINPILASISTNTPGLSNLRIDAIDFGTVPLTINSVYFDHNDESVIRLDLNFSWSSDLLAIIEAKPTLSPVTFKVEGKNPIIHGTIRIELKSSVGDTSCPRQFSVAFAQNPEFDLTLGFQSLDMVNVGVGSEFNLAILVRDVLKNHLIGRMVYPNCIPISMGTSMDVKLGSVIHAAVPVGIVVLRVIDIVAEHSRRDDTSISSVICCNQFCETAPCLRVRLNATHSQITRMADLPINIMSFSREDIIECDVFDSEQDTLNSNESLGYCRISLSEIGITRECKHYQLISNRMSNAANQQHSTSESGRYTSLCLEIQYVPLSKTVSQKRTELLSRKEIESVVSSVSSLTSSCLNPKFINNQDGETKESSDVTVVVLISILENEKVDPLMPGTETGRGKNRMTVSKCNCYSIISHLYHNLVDYAV